MKYIFFILVCLIPSVCLGQTVFVDPTDNVKIQSDVSNLQYGYNFGARRTIRFDNSNGTTTVISQADLPPDVGYIYLYDEKTQKGVIEFSRPNFPLIFYGSGWSWYGDCHRRGW